MQPPGGRVFQGPGLPPCCPPQPPRPWLQDQVHVSDMKGCGSGGLGVAQCVDTEERGSGGSGHYSLQPPRARRGGCRCASPTHRPPLVLLGLCPVLPQELSPGVRLQQAPAVALETAAAVQGEGGPGERARTGGWDPSSQVRPAWRPERGGRRAQVPPAVCREVLEKATALCLPSPSHQRGRPHRTPGPQVDSPPSQGSSALNPEPCRPAADGGGDNVRCGAPQGPRAHQGHRPGLRQMSAQPCPRLPVPAAKGKQPQCPSKDNRGTSQASLRCEGKDLPAAPGGGLVTWSRRGEVSQAGPHCRSHLAGSPEQPDLRRGQEVLSMGTVPLGPEGVCGCTTSVLDTRSWP